MLGSIVSVIIVWVFAPRMPRGRVKGAQEQRRWEAFRNYLEDLTRFQDMATAQEQFEKYLPYAVALGVEREWVRRFEGLTVSPPMWYHPSVPIPMGGIRRRPMSTGPLETGILGGTMGGGAAGAGGGFSLDTISDGLFGSLDNMSSVLTSAPPSSGSGGAGSAEAAAALAEASPAAAEEAASGRDDTRRA